MHEFQLKLFEQGLQLVRSEDDADELAIMVIDHMMVHQRIHGSYMPELEELKDDEILCDLIDALRILIDHERRTAEKPSFVNIFMTLGTIKGEQELANNPQWVDFCRLNHMEYHQFMVSCLNRILNEFKQLVRRPAA